MTDLNPTPISDSTSNSASNSDVPPTPGRCFRGSLISGGLAFAMYSLTQSIIQTLANTPLPSKSPIAANIAVAVRTLVIGVCTMGTAIFAISTLGLFALGIQIWFKQRSAQN